MRLGKTLTVIIVSATIFFGAHSFALAADDNTPCPTIGGVESYMPVPGAKCVFPNGSFPIGSPEGQKAQKDLTDWNILHRTTSISGVSDGNRGATPINGAGDITPSQQRTANGVSGTCDTWICTAGKIVQALTDLPAKILNAIASSAQWIFWAFFALAAQGFFFSAMMLLWLSTTFMDLVIVYLVLDMGNLINSGPGIHTAWALIRDLTNILIIAGFVIVGISTILQAAQYAADKFLTQLIIAALLVNFSFFIAGAVIDFSNYVASQVYTSSIMQNTCGEAQIKLPGNMRYQPIIGSGRGIDVNLCSVGINLSTSLGLGTWANVRDIARNDNRENVSVFSYDTFKANERIDYQKKVAILGFMGGLFFVIAGFVLFSAAILLLGRFVVLIILLITSPIGIAGAGIPFIDQYAQQWRSALIGQALFAPVYFILLALSMIVIKMLIGSLKNSSPTSFASLASGNYGAAMESAPMVLTFGVAIGLMYAALMIAKRMSNTGSEFFGEIYGALDKSLGGIYGNMYQATAGRVLFGTRAAISMGYDATIGQLSRAFIPTGLGGKVPLPFIGQILGAVGQTLRPTGSGKPFGATQTVPEMQKASAEYQKSLPRTAEGVKRWWVDGPGKSTDDLIKTVNRLEEQRLRDGKLSPEDQAKLDEAQKELKLRAMALSDDDINGMPVKELMKMMPYMSSAQAQKALNRADLTDKQRESLNNARYARLEAARARGDDEEVKKLLRDMDETDHKLYFSQRKEARTDEKMLALLDKKTFDSVTSDRTVFSADEAGKARDLRGVGQTNALRSGDAAAVKHMLSKMSPEEKGKMDLETFEKALPHMSAADIKHAYEHDTSGELRARIDGDDKLRQMKDGTGVNKTPKAQNPPPPPSTPPAGNATIIDENTGLPSGTMGTGPNSYK